MKPEKLITKDFLVKIKAVDDEKKSIRFVVSAPIEDRHGEIVDQNGWKLEEYKPNPVVLFAHNMFEPAVGKAIDIAVVAGQLEAEIQFAVEEYPFAGVLYNLYKGRFMNAVSPGFRNDVFEYDENNDTITLKENTLYEISLVNVPANSLALAKHAGIDTEPLEEKLKDIAQKRREQYSLESKAIDLSEGSIKKLSEEIANKLEKLSSADTTTVKTTQVETPKVKGGQYGQIRKINRVIRQLRKEKEKLSN